MPVEVGEVVVYRVGEVEASNSGWEEACAGSRAASGCAERLKWFYVSNPGHHCLQELVQCSPSSLIKSWTCASILASKDG